MAASPGEPAVTPEKGPKEVAPARREAPLEVQSSLPSRVIPVWNSQGRLASTTPEEKRRRLSADGLPLRINLRSEFEKNPRRKSKRKTSINAVLFLLCLHMSCPQNYNQALQSPEYARWKESMSAEITALRDRKNCWTVVPYPEKPSKILRCHFVYKIKMKDGRPDRYKSRLVVDGSKQQEGIDFKERFAPVIRYNTLRLLLAISAVHHMSIYQLDVENAFINAPLSENVYVHPHPEMLSLIHI